MTREQMSDVWQAFSTLSDAQELMAMGQREAAIQMVNHAKRHLDRAMQVEGDEARRQAIMDTPLVCRLGFDGEKE